MQRKKILFICGSHNQTTMMHQISMHLGDHDLWFTPFYVDGVLGRLQRRGLLDFTIAGHKHRAAAFAYMQQHDLQIDDQGMSRQYDLVVTCSDLIVPKNIRKTPIVLVQEGMTDPENVFFYLSKYLGLPRYLASTSTTGLSDMYDRFCVASPGYRDLFVRKGIDPDKVVVTGIPNYDNCVEYRNRPFSHTDYVLVATSDARETFKYENRKAFLYDALDIACGRQLIVKLHPNEQIARAVDEIRRYAPDAIVYPTGDINAMIAHCDALVTKYSTVVYVGLALNKEVHSAFPIDELRALTPLQNGGRSAGNIATVCMEAIDAADRAGRAIHVPNYRISV